MTKRKRVQISEKIKGLKIWSQLYCLWERILAFFTLESFADEETLRKFWNNMYFLKNILFSFIFGFGLTRLHEALQGTIIWTNLYKLFIAYIAFFIDWVSYNWVIYINKEYERQNAIIFMLDFLQAYIYWGLLDSFNKPVIITMVLYSILFFGFVVWCKRRSIIDRDRR